MYGYYYVLVLNKIYFTDNIVNSTNMLELWYLIDVYVSSYLSLDAMICKYITCSVCICTGSLLCVVLKLDQECKLCND